MFFMWLSDSEMVCCLKGNGAEKGVVELRWLEFVCVD